MLFACAVPIRALQWEGRARSLCVATGRHVYVLANALGLKVSLHAFSNMYSTRILYLSNWESNTVCISAVGVLCCSGARALAGDASEARTPRGRGARARRGAARRCALATRCRPEPAADDCRRRHRRHSRRRAAQRLRSLNPNISHCIRFSGPASASSLLAAKRSLELLLCSSSTVTVSVQYWQCYSYAYETR